MDGLKNADQILTKTKKGGIVMPSVQDVFMSAKNQQEEYQKRNCRF